MRIDDAELVSNTRNAIEVGASSRPANPRRAAAGKRNRALRKGLTEEGRRRLQEAARRNQPWKYSRGRKRPRARLGRPRTPKISSSGRAASAR
jgi:hypothetical protein